MFMHKICKSTTKREEFNVFNDPLKKFHLRDQENLRHKKAVLMNIAMIGINDQGIKRCQQLG